MRIDVNCSKWLDFNNENDLPGISAQLKGCPYIILGGGSNVLFTSNYPGTILHSSILDIDVDVKNDSIYIKAGSGVEMDSLIYQCCCAGYWGLENLSGIPGDVGASAVQNIGAYGVEAKDIIVEVRCYDMINDVFLTFSNADCEYDYRWSMFKRDDIRYRYVITYVTYKLSKKPAPHLEYSNLKDKFSGGIVGISPMEIRNMILNIRNQKLPSVDTIGSAGSFFKNPIVSTQIYKNICQKAKSLWGEDCVVPNYPINSDIVKIPAAWLIERVGLKGYIHGNAGVWHLQPLVIVNLTGKATSTEILEVESIVTNKVFDQFGITLHAEIDHI